MSGGLIVKKKGMTKIRVDGDFVSVTMVQVLPQEVLRYKTQEKDGYAALVMGIEKKSNTTKGKLPYKSIVEFDIDDSFVTNHKQWEVVDISLMDDVDSISVVWTAIGKGFQWVMKRFHTKGGPKTHGSKFHRQIGSLWNRKPRRVQMWHPHAGRMGWQQVTLTNIKIIDRINDEQVLILKGSLPWANTSYLKLVIK